MSPVTPAGMDHVTKTGTCNAMCSGTLGGTSPGTVLATSKGPLKVDPHPTLTRAGWGFPALPGMVGINESMATDQIVTWNSTRIAPSAPFSQIVISPGWFGTSKATFPRRS